MKVYLDDNVKEAALSRIRFLFDEFENIVVGISGGKDSTVLLELTLTVARELNRLPLPVMWLDQEAEWQGTVDYVTEVMEREEVDPLWFQMPFYITNNASIQERYSYCWEVGKETEYIHPRHSKSIKENVYGTMRFHELFEAILKHHYPNQKACYLSGVRGEEAPKRMMAMSSAVTYNDITWAKHLYKPFEHYTFYPIYDWSYKDVWKYINDNDCKYNRVYDGMYRHGVGIHDMRISNLHHETAIQSIKLVQEIEPETWNKVAARIQGANTIKHLQDNSFRRPKELPEAFQSWKEYCHYLAEHLIPDPERKERFYEVMRNYSKRFDGANIVDKLHQKAIDTILSADWDFTKLENWTKGGYALSYKNFKLGKYNTTQLKDRRYFTAEELKTIMANL